MKNIPLAKPSLDFQEQEAVSRVLQSGWITQGPEVKEFEAEFCDYVGSGFACAVSSCTTGLHLALKALGIGEGDKVITVSHSFVATANAILYDNSIPIFIDIDLNTLNIDPNKIEAAIDPQVKAILAVHQVGMPVDIEKIKEIAHKHNLFIIEDAACAVGSEVLIDEDWEKIGKPHGDIAVFSFHPRKVITTGDGGMITTNNSAIDKKLKLLRQHGMSINDTARHNSEKYIQEQYIELGYNYRMTDIQAAIGRVQLKKLNDILEERRKLANYYINLLEKSSKISIYKDSHNTRTNFQSFIIRVKCPEDQQNIIDILFKKKISVKRGITCIHREPAYKNIQWMCDGDRSSCNCNPGHCEKLSMSELAQDSCIILPLYPGMTSNEQDLVVNSILSYLEEKND